MKKIMGVLGVVFCLMLAGCASQKQDTIEKRNTDISKDLTYDHSMELEYAKMFAVDYYQNDYALVTIADDGKYLIVPEGESVPEDMDKDITVLQQPIQNIYLAASAAMDMFVATDALDAVRFSSLKADGWYIEEAKKAMEDGDIIYAGKYSAPDYEMILNENCGLAIENTMILHTPEVKEQMEKFNIPVLGEVGDDADTVNDDKKAVAEAITSEAVATANYDSLDAAKEDGVAFVFMGHGTSHTAKVSYSQMQAQMKELGYENVFIGTVEGEPEETACEEVIKAVSAAGYKKVILRPLMVVAGDHANNDMAGDDDDSWKSQFEASGKFDSIDTQIAGLGEIKAIQDLYVAHTADAINE